MVFYQSLFLLLAIAAVRVKAGCNSNMTYACANFLGEGVTPPLVTDCCEKCCGPNAIQANCPGFVWDDRDPTKCYAMKKSVYHTMNFYTCDMLPECPNNTYSGAVSNMRGTTVSFMGGGGLGGSTRMLAGEEVDISWDDRGYADCTYTPSTTIRWMFEGPTKASRICATLTLCDRDGSDKFTVDRQWDFQRKRWGRTEIFSGGTTTKCSTNKYMRITFSSNANIEFQAFMGTVYLQ